MNGSSVNLTEFAPNHLPDYPGCKAIVTWLLLKKKFPRQEMMGLQNCKTPGGLDFESSHSYCFK
jgi:hypothetical protein